MMPGLATLKRGSIQVQRAAKVVNGKSLNTREIRKLVGVKNHAKFSLFM